MTHAALIASMATFLVFMVLISLRRSVGLDDTCSSLAGYRNVLPLFCVATKDDIADVGEVSKYMVKSPTTVFKKTTLNEVAKIMYHNDFGQLPVHGDKDELIGMIYDVDVLAALLEESE